MAFAASMRSLGRAGLFALSVLRASKPTADLFAELVKEIYKVGARSLPIIVVGGAFVGLVLTLQGYRTLATFGAADALSTALLCMGLDEGMRYAEAQGIAALFMVRDDDDIAVEWTPAFHQLAHPG